MKLLICGGRDFDDKALFDREIAKLDPPPTAIISGGARGADRLAIDYARAHRLPLQVFMADWDTYGKAAGHIRNQRMLDEGKPDAVLAMPGGSGTADMMRRAMVAGLPLYTAKPQLH